MKKKRVKVIGKKRIDEKYRLKDRHIKETNINREIYEKRIKEKVARNKRREKAGKKVLEGRNRVGMSSLNKK